MAGSFLAAMLLAKWLGAERQGLYALAILIPTTVYFLGMLGISTANVVYAGKYPAQRGTIAIHSLLFSAIIGSLFVIVYRHIINIGPSWFVQFQAVGKQELYIASYIVFFQMGMNFLRSGILGAGKIFLINIQTILTPMFKLILLCLLIGWLGYGVFGGIISQLGSFVITFLVVIIITLKIAPLNTWKPNLSFFYKSLVFGLKIHINNLTWFLAHTADRYMIAYLMPGNYAALGQYTVAAQLTATIWILPQSLQTVFLPHLSYTKQDRAVITTRATRVLFIALLPVMAILACGSIFIPYLIGRDYTGTIAPFITFLPGLLLYGATRPLESYLTHIEKPLYAAGDSFVGMVVNICLNLYWIPKFGILGAAMASTVSSILMAVIMAVCYLYETKLPFKELLPRKEDFLLFKNLFIKLIKQNIRIGRRPV